MGDEPDGDVNDTCKNRTAEDASAYRGHADAVNNNWSMWCTSGRCSWREAPLIDGLGNDQLFFLAYAQCWCTHITEEAQRLQTSLDTHSPPHLSVNVPLAHLPGFWDAWQCGPGTPMHADPACEVW